MNARQIGYEAQLAFEGAASNQQKGRKAWAGPFYRRRTGSTGREGEATTAHRVSVRPQQEVFSSLAENSETPRPEQPEVSFRVGGRLRPGPRPQRG